MTQLLFMGQATKEVFRKIYCLLSQWHLQPRLQRPKFNFYLAFDWLNAAKIETQILT